MAQRVVTGRDAGGRRRTRVRLQVRPPAGGSAAGSVLRLLAPLFLLEGAFLWLVASLGTVAHGPDAYTFSCDFGMFWAAGHAVMTGNNPYLPGSLYHLEQHLLLRDGVQTIANRSVVRVGNPPLFFWLLRPFVVLPFRTAALLWTGAMALCVLAGGLVVLSALGWSRRAIPTALILLSPPVLLAVIYGNNVPVVFLGLALCHRLAVRNPVLCGLCASVAWLKPALALPLAALILLFLVRTPLRAIGGFLAATLGAALATALILGPQALPNWFVALRGYTRDMAVQPSIASLSGFYVRWAPAAWQSGIELLLLLLAGGVTLAVWWHARRRPITPNGLAALWFLWFLSTPYDHYIDEIVLVIPLLLVAGVDGRNVGSRRVASTVYIVAASIFVLSVVAGSVQILPLPLTLAAGLLVPWRSALGGVGNLVPRSPAPRPTLQPDGG